MLLTPAHVLPAGGLRGRFSADKRLFGWTLPQRRAERFDTASTAQMTWHNLFNLHGPDHPIAAA